MRKTNSGVSRLCVVVRVWDSHHYASKRSVLAVWRSWWEQNCVLSEQTLWLNSSSRLFPALKSDFTGCVPGVVVYFGFGMNHCNTLIDEGEVCHTQTACKRAGNQVLWLNLFRHHVHAQTHTLTDLEKHVCQTFYTNFVNISLKAASSTFKLVMEQSQFNTDASIWYDDEHIHMVHWISFKKWCTFSCIFLHFQLAN